jgi:CBS domain-containing protein
VAKVMTAGVLTVKPDTTIQHVMNVFAEKRCRHLPVVDGDKLVGLISIGDVSRWVASLHKAEAESLREYISGGLPG